MEENHSVAGHDVGVHSLVGEVEGGLHEPEELGLDLRVVDEVLPGTLELPVGHDPVLGGGHLLLPLQADLLGLCSGGLQLVTPEPAEFNLSLIFRLILFYKMKMLILICFYDHKSHNK